MKRKSIVFVVLLAVILTVLLFGCAKGVKGLVSPSNIRYDGKLISWDAVTLPDQLVSYTVSINGGEAKPVLAGTTYTYDAKGQAFDVVVSASVKDVIENSESIHFEPLGTISDLSVSQEGVISWTAIDGATGYEVSFGNNTYTTTETQYVIPEGNYRVKVKPVAGSFYYSFWSAEKTVNILKAPTNLNYDGEKISWIGNASQYEININGQTENVSGGKYVYDSENRDFSVEVKALGDHTSTFDSSVATETFHYLQPARDLTVESGILSWSEVENAEGYQIKINGVVQRDNLTSNRYEKLASGSSIEVAILPYNKSGKYFSYWSETKNVYILETPIVSWNADLELDGEANNNFIWNAVNGAAGYTVQLEQNGVVTETNYPALQVAYANAYSKVGTYKVRVKAIAEIGTDYYDSKYSADLTVERLSAPKAAGANFITSNSSDLSKGFTVNYSAVSGATGYQLYKDGVLLDGKRVSSLSITDSDVADDSISAEQTYNYYVRSLGGVKTISGKTYVFLPCLTSEALSFEITIQAMPTDLTMSGFNAQWSAVSGNNGYAVSYGGNVFSATSTSFDLSTLKAGTYTVAVCTKGNGGATLASNYTAGLSVVRLIAPTNITISYGTGEGQLNFTNVANAKSYQVFLDQSEQALPENAYDNMYQYIAESGTVLHMISVANYFNDLGTVYYMTSESSPTQQFIRLAAPTFPDGAFANSIELVWSASANINTAEYTPTYEVYESNVMQTGGIQNATKFNIQYLEGGSSYTFRVKAVGNDSKYLDSSMSVAVTIYKLNTPELYINDNMYNWNGVTNASSYVLEIDGVRVNNDIHVSGSAYSYVPHYTTIGNHTVKLYAVGDGYNTINSNNYVYTQVVRACLSPEIEYGYSNDSFVNGGTIDVSITTPSANCLGYLYEIAGESISSVALTASKPIESTGSYVVRVKALGGAFDGDEVYYIDSQYAGGGSGYTIILLAPPTVATFSINSDGAVKWGTITNANGYDYQIALGDEEYSAVRHTGTASLNPINGFKNFRSIKIRVKACGNNDNIVNSAWIEYIWTNPNK